MQVKQGLMRVLGFVLLSSAAAWAGTITDPAMGVDEGAFSDPLTGSSVFSPNNGGGVFGFYNATGSVITSLTFQTQLLSGLTPLQISLAFTCNDANTVGHPNPFFLNCNVAYASGTGLLTISFFGTNPLDGDELPTDPFQESEVGEQQGIPALLSGCEFTPDDVGCTGIGHFTIVLNDNFSTTGASGGWSFSANPDLFNVGGPSFSVLEIGTSASPEPASLLLVGTGLAGFAVLRRRQRRKSRS